MKEPLLCHCGSKLISKGIDGGCQIYECSGKKCGSGYRIPLDEGKCEFPGDHILRGWTPPDAPPNAYVPVPESVPAPDVPFVPAPEPVPAPDIPVAVGARVYRCKSCGAEITKEQATQSYQESGKAMCKNCNI